jgi:hypothetical protein
MSDAKDHKPEPSRARRLTAGERAAMAADDKARDRERYGPASEGRSVTSWRCDCGWSGDAKALKATDMGVACPACGATGGLVAQ